MGEWNDLDGWNALVARVLERRARRIEVVSLGTAANSVLQDVERKRSRKVRMAGEPVTRVVEKNRLREASRNDREPKPPAKLRKETPQDAAPVRMAVRTKLGKS